MQVNSKQELAALHLIRGICALSVMAYHYLHTSQIGTFDAIGTYGVYIFFILSGFVLYHVYGNDEISEKNLRNFYIARFFRIAPLYIAVATYKLINVAFIEDNFYRYILNIGLVFGLGNPGDTSFVVGGWSIGIEFAFYLLFPAIILLRSVRSLSCVFVLSLFMNHFLTNLSYNNTPDNAQDWGFYTQPLTFLCYFIGGMLLAKILNRHSLMNRFNSFWLCLSIIALMASTFAFPYIVEWSREALLYGWQSKILIAASFSIVALGAVTKISGAGRSLSMFVGNISYAVYLIHMPVLGLIRSTGMAGTTAILMAALTTIAAAFFIYHYFESPMRALQWRYRLPKPL
jgi:peptidoglycan/LPS O-acetylase OafA/YrhL